MTGIPEYRLPKEVVEYEVGCLRELGIEFREGVRVAELDGVLEGFEAVIVATGVEKVMRLGVPGEDLRGVLDAYLFLRWVNALCRGRIGAMARAMEVAQIVHERIPSIPTHESVYDIYYVRRYGRPFPQGGGGELNSTLLFLYLLLLFLYLLLLRLAGHRGSRFQSEYKFFPRERPHRQKFYPARANEARVGGLTGSL